MSFVAQLPGGVTRQPAGSPGAVASRWGVLVVLGLEALLVVSGQVDRDLVTMDDLREAEVAREMAEDGNCVVPHLAGLPFVEKPPGFQFLVALLFTVLGGPSVAGARLVSAGFALAALSGVFLLGRRAWGTGGGVLASAFLAFSPLFIRVSHEILLDNALLASMAFAWYFLASALLETERGPKRRAYAAAAFALGVAFLMKGLTGPSLAAAGLLAYLLASRDWGELRAALHPLPVAAFLVPVLLWLVPFLRVAPSELVHEFFVRNHLGRFLSAYISHDRPFYFYLATLGYKFAPGVLVLPFAAVAAWKERTRPGGKRGLVLLSFSLGPLLLLSVSRAKDAVYLLPVYPAFSALSAGWCLRAFPSRAPAGWIGGVAVTISFGVSLAAVAATLWLGGITPAAVLVAGAVAALSVVLVRALSKRQVAAAGTALAALWGCAALLFLSGPVAAWDQGQGEWRAAMADVLPRVEGKELLLYHPDDEIRGACGFYRRRTALEIDEPALFVRRVADGEETLGLVRVSGTALPEELLEEASRVSVVLEERLQVRCDGRTLFLVSAKSRPVIRP